MASITFSEKEIKRLILALAGSKDMAVEESVEEESPQDEADPVDKAEDKVEAESEGEAGKPHGEKVDTKEMLRKKLEGKK